MVRRLEQWPWSSYLATCGQAADPGWLQVDFVLSQFASQRARAIARYVAFVHEGAKLSSVWSQLEGQVYLGSEAFVKKTKLPHPYPRSAQHFTHARHFRVYDRHQFVGRGRHGIDAHAQEHFLRFR